MSAHCVAQATLDAAERLECGNERYEDFFKRQHDKEKQEQLRAQSADEIKGVRRERIEKMNEARREYKREKTVEDPNLEREWNEQAKAWKDQNDLARRRFVDRREAQKKSQCRSLNVPEMKEYELEDY